MKIVEMIKFYRRHLGETQEQFARRFNTTANTVSRWESGKYQVPNEVIDRLLSDEFGVIEVICPLCGGSGLYKKISQQIPETYGWGKDVITTPMGADSTYVVPDMSKTYVEKEINEKHH